MRICVSVLLSVAFTPLIVLGQTKQSDPMDGRNELIGISGGVEISAIRVKRERVSYSAKSAKLNSMDLTICPTLDYAPGNADFLVQLIELSPIEDNTGTLLSTDERLENIDCLKGETKCSETHSFRGRQGPVVHLMLDAPRRGAESLKLIRGKVKVSRGITVKAVFLDPAAISGKELKHKSLEGFSTHMTIEHKDGETTLVLKVPPEHSRLVTWGLGKDGILLTEDFKSESVRDGAAILETRYKVNYSQDLFLGLIVARPTISKTLEFEFKNIALP
ncbi:MAG: hypothetical protein JSS27_04055 [Planctomycetes bacterium]|nr:hypothetical protein [Planctomycetota bacterium]